jgi:hypothetical protein
MSLEAIRLRIQTPTEHVWPGRGFYQRDEDSLYVQVGPFESHRRCFSFIESPGVRLDIDRDGRLMFIEVAVPRRRWRIDTKLISPVAPLSADIRWLDFRRMIRSPRLVVSPSGNLLAIHFSDRPVAQSMLVADSVIVQAAADSSLAAIQVTEIADDFAGIKLASFRRRIRRDMESVDSTRHYNRLPA